MNNQIVQIHILSAVHDLDDIAVTARLLKDEIRSLDDIGEVRFAKLEAGSEKSKTGSAIDFQNLLVTLIASGGMSALIAFLDNWLHRHKEYSVILELDGQKLEVKGLDSKERRELIDIWKDRINENNQQNGNEPPLE